MISVSIMCALVIWLFGGSIASSDEQHIARSHRDNDR
jgi:hypothetical protein